LSVAKVTLPPEDGWAAPVADVEPEALVLVLPQPVRTGVASRAAARASSGRRVEFMDLRKAVGHHFQVSWSKITAIPTNNTNKGGGVSNRI
jgi:hypothetical protein